MQFASELDRISHGADVVGQSVPGGRTRCPWVGLTHWLVRDFSFWWVGSTIA